MQAPAGGRGQDHPRIRGEHPGWEGWQLGSEGSSPHTRGAHLAEESRQGLAGIIPAYAGSTPAPTPSAAGGGSSPHTRGAPEARRVARRRRRIIPAYAGSTRRRGRLQHGRPDHPRIRGEHSDLAASKSTPRGSSPHTRGAPSAGGREHAPIRIIPAYAGSTAWRAGSWRRRPDHPRIRGEHRVEPDRAVRAAGSSPHTRGARRPERQPPQ